ncbi:phosphatase PAP2 family protein [Actinomadura rubrisoli]|uniref:Phosphatase PAP2 family protein n=1 Tax=Actinomadura rubrisoli TaxID=2530368 RepID=A0A4R5BE29_9ACTN|nr:phosphatase PAP2 family protein [Actinomadura rubrisoli]
MEPESQYQIVPRVLGAAASMVAGALALVLLWPGGLGETGPVKVTSGASASVYRDISDAAADAPSFVGSAADLAGDGLLLVLGVLLAVTGLLALRRRSARDVGAAILVGVATVGGYVVSEALKLVVDEERPCRAVPGARAVAECPPTGDWAFPSNHAALAVGLAVGLAILRPRLAIVSIPLGAAVIPARVASGAHYPHDVLAGAALGGAVAAVTMLLFTPFAAWAVARPLGWRDEPGLVGDHGGGRPVVHGQPRQDRADMAFDGSLHHPQAPGDLPVGQPRPQEGQHLPFPGRERRDLPAGGAAPSGSGPRPGGQMGDHPGGDLR